MSKGAELSSQPSQKRHLRWADTCHGGTHNTCHTHGLSGLLTPREELIFPFRPEEVEAKYKENFLRSWAKGWVIARIYCIFRLLLVLSLQLIPKRLCKSEGILREAHFSLWYPGDEGPANEG